LSYIQFFVGDPKNYISFRASRVSKSGTEFNFSKSAIKEGIWIACYYSNSAVSLTTELLQNTRTCNVKLLPKSSKILSIDCEQE
jgi:hypothetical protein